MKIGTRSVLYGAHCFFLHPWFVAWGWTRLYGFPRDPRLWLVFFVHDLGYVGLPNMDGPEGEAHVELGALLLGRLFGPEWAYLSRYHSRYWAKRDDCAPSRLCYADKLAIVLTPRWLYLPMARWSGEIYEYMDPELHEDGGKYETHRMKYRGSQVEWFDRMIEYLAGWVEEETPAEWRR